MGFFRSHRRPTKTWSSKRAQMSKMVAQQVLAFNMVGPFLIGPWKQKETMSILLGPLFGIPHLRPLKDMILGLSNEAYLMEMCCHCRGPQKPTGVCVAPLILQKSFLLETGRGVKGSAIYFTHVELSHCAQMWFVLLGSNLKSCRRPPHCPERALPSCTCGSRQY